MLHIANNRCEKTLEQLTRTICIQGEEEGRMESQIDEQRTVFFLGLRSELCCLVGSSATVKAWPGHIGAGWGQRGASGGAQHYTDASPTTMSHFRPLWFGLGGWPPASWSSLSSSFACSLHFLFDLLLPLSLLFLCMFAGLPFFSLYPVNLFPLSPSKILTVRIAKFHQSSGGQS